MPIRFVLVTLAVLVAGAACSKTVGLDLQLVEPCDQKAQALNGISSFRVSTSGGASNDTVTFTVDQGPQPLAVGLGQVLVTVQAFANDVSTGAAAATPQAIGRTVPLSITEQSQDAKALVLVGELDSFGKTTAADGSCTSMTAGAPITGRHGHTATFVPVLNKVLIFGGAVIADDGSERFLSTAELWDPSTGAFEQLPDIGSARAFHAATALPDGRVLISGGFGVVSGHVSALLSAVVFDPSRLADPFSPLFMKQARANHTSTLMEGAGLVVLAGGCVGNTEADGCTPTSAARGGHGPSTQLPLASMETFDITQPTGAAVTVAVPNTGGLQFPRAFHQATSLENGQATVLVVTGGTDETGPRCEIEFFRASGGTLQRVINAAAVPFPAGQCPVRHAAVAIDQHHVMTIGGLTTAANGVLNNAGNALNRAFVVGDALGVNQTDTITLLNGGTRVGALAAQLIDGSVVVVGGVTAPDAPPAEVLRVGVGPAPFTPQPLAGPAAIEARDHAALAVLPNNELFYCGGESTSPPIKSSSSADIFFGP